LVDSVGCALDLARHIDFGTLPQLLGIEIELHPEQYEVAGMRECKTILRDAGFERIEDLSSRTVWVAQRKTEQV